MNILVIESSPRGELSVSRKLTSTIVEKLKERSPGSQVHVRDLVEAPLPHFDPVRSNRESEEALKELFEADTIVIAAPMWNFGLPSALKAWIDHICLAGKTFRFSEKGPEGLVRDKRAVIAVASGGIYSDGPAKAADFVEPYLRTVLGFIGITEVSTVRAEGLAIPGVQDHALEKAVQSIRV